MVHPPSKHGAKSSAAARDHKVMKPRGSTYERDHTPSYADSYADIMSFADIFAAFGSDKSGSGPDATEMPPWLADAIKARAPESPTINRPSSCLV